MNLSKENVYYGIILFRGVSINVIGGFYCKDGRSAQPVDAYYLMAELVAAEASKVRGVYESHQTEPVVWGPEIDLFSEFMDQVGSL